MEKRDIQFVSILLVLCFGFIVVRNAWVSDDAYITFRPIENFLSGNGLGYNPNVRVQSFTHPLWMFLLSAVYVVPLRLLGISSENGLYFLALLVSVALSTATLFLLLTKVIKSDTLSLLLLAFSLTLSRAFIDFSTSGLENPLTHFLLAIFIWKFFSVSRRFLMMVFLSALIALTRLDAMLLVIPALAFIFWSERAMWRRNILILLIGFSPLLLWEIFSLFYFGFPFPNTAYAKLNTGVSSVLLVEQGIDYYLNSLNWDPLTLLMIAFAGVGVFFEKKRGAIFIYVGVIFYTTYILKIGGDFMSGRFLTAPLLISATLFSRLRVFAPRYRVIGLVVIMALGIVSVRSTLLDPQAQPNGELELVDKNGISDQRIYYFGRGRDRGLVVRGIRDTDVGSPYAGANWVFTGFTDVAVERAAGMYGYLKGPNIYSIDIYALVDPVLARLPTIDPVNWRIGHFEREIPAGYVDTLKTGKIQIIDTNLAMYYEKLNFVISGPLWNWQRIVEIWKFNTGQYDYLLRAYVAHLP